MKTYDYNGFGKTYSLRLRKEQYTYNDNMAVLADCESEYGGWEPFANVTVNLDEKLPDGYGYVDTNNFRGVLEWIEENNIGTFTGIYRQSGFCKYPLVKFNEEVFENV